MWVKRTWTDHCPICNSPIKLDDDCYIANCNEILFPGSLIHAECIIEPSSIEGMVWMNFNKATEFMHQNYQEFKSKYRAWIR